MTGRSPVEDERSSGAGSRDTPSGPRLLFWHLPVSLLLALRYLRSTRSDAFTSFLSLVAAGGIGLGVLALVLALAALAGLQDALRGEVLARTPHLEVALPAAADADEVEARLAGVDGVHEVQQVAAGRGWIRLGRLVQPVGIVGYSGLRPQFFPGVAGAENGLYVSERLQARWGLEPGIELQVVSPLPTLTPLGPQPRTRTLPLAGTFETGRTEEEERIALPLAVARVLVGEGSVRLQLTTAGLEPALALVPRLAEVLPAGAEVRTWQELNRPLFFALRLEKSVMFVAVSLIVVVAALALVADLALVLVNKRSELGTLATLGTSPGRLRRTFLWLGAIVAGIGMGAGGGLGWAGAILLDRYRLIRLPGQVYFLDYLPFRVEGSDVLSVCLVTGLLALLASYVVAQRAERLAPAEAMRR
jgi:lipoprotein-releasing system permease protein